MCNIIQIKNAEEDGSVGQYLAEDAAIVQAECEPKQKKEDSKQKTNNKTKKLKKIGSMDDIGKLLITKSQPSKKKKTVTIKE